MIPSVTTQLQNHSFRGIEVETTRIREVLADFWKQSASGATRASLINIAIYSEVPGSSERNAELVAEITREHACRSILIEARLESNQSAIRSWVNAHCNLGKAGDKEICCEQVVFELSGRAGYFVSNLLFSHLDSDLPLYFWWQDGFENGLEPQIAKWTDRLIFDSATWRDPTSHFKKLQNSMVRLHAKGTLCDLNWARSLPLRRALAHVFDHPTPLNALNSIRSVTITHSPNHTLCAKLFLAWIALQLGWTSHTNPSKSTSELSFRDSSGNIIIARLKQSAGTAISQLFIEAGAVEISIWAEDSDAPIRCSTCVNGICSFDEQMPPGMQDTPSLLRMELATGGRHLTYPRLLDLILAWP